MAALQDDQADWQSQGTQAFRTGDALTPGQHGVDHGQVTVDTDGSLTRFPGQVGDLIMPQTPAL